MTTSSNGNSVEDDDNILEGTLALIKPDAVDRAKEIINIIISEGFLIVEKKRFQFSREVKSRGHIKITTQGFSMYCDMEVCTMRYRYPN